MKKNMKKVLALALAAVMVMALCGVAFAATTVTTPAAATKGTGTFDITMTGAEAGHTFKAYRIFDGSLSADGKMGDISWATGVNLAEISGKDIYADLTAAGLTLTENTAVGVAKALAGGSFDSETAQKVANVFYARKGSVVGSANTANASGNYVIEDVPVGYYIVTDEYTSGTAADGAATLSRNIMAVVGDVTAAVKNTKPTIEKKILDPTAVDANEAGVGETVVYQITGAVPNYVGYDKYFYVINDKLSDGLTFNADSVVVTVNGVAATAGTDYVLYTSSTTPAVASGYTFQVAFKNIKGYTVGNPIVVKYSAIVNANAVIGGTGNPNEVDLIYSNNPNDSGDGNPSDNPRPDEYHPTGKTPKDRTITYVAELDLTKYFDEVKDGNQLAGATFVLEGTSNVPVGTTAEKFVEDTNGIYYKLKTGTYTTTVPHGEIKRSDGTTEIASNEADYESTTIKYKLTSETSYSSEAKKIILEGTSAAGTGKIVFTGLGAGTYTIKEIVTPEGYTTAADITFTISVDVPATITSGSETATWSSNNTLVTVGATTGVYATDVIDLSGVVLPSTGGIGTTIFYVSGLIMVLGAAVILISRRRADAE